MARRVSRRPCRISRWGRSLRGPARCEPQGEALALMASSVRWARRLLLVRGPFGKEKNMATIATKPLAVVTGASRGIGYELAKEFATHGFDLVICADTETIHEA